MRTALICCYFGVSSMILNMFDLWTKTFTFMVINQPVKKYIIKIFFELFTITCKNWDGVLVFGYHPLKKYTYTNSLIFCYELGCLVIFRLSWLKTKVNYTQKNLEWMDVIFIFSFTFSSDCKVIDAQACNNGSGSGHIKYTLSLHCA